MHALAACACLPPFVSAVSFARLAALASGTVGHPRRPPPPDALLAAYISQVLRRLPPPWRYTCLRRSLVLFYLLRRAGRPVALHIGVRKQDGALQAEAVPGMGAWKQTRRRLGGRAARGIYRLWRATRSRP